MKKKKSFWTIRKVLSLLLGLSVIYAVIGMYYKICYWGFNIAPNQKSDVWTVEAQIGFEPTGEPIKATLTVPGKNASFKILEEAVVADGYKIAHKSNGTNKVIFTAPAKYEMQNIYYRILLFDTSSQKGKDYSSAPNMPTFPQMEEQRLAVANRLIKLSEKFDGNAVQKIIKLFSANPPIDTVVSFLPMKKTPQETANAIRELLAIKGIATRISKGVKLEENRTAILPDIMLEAWMEGKWMVYNIETAEMGIPDNFVLFQRGGESLLDVEGGQNSFIKFSVIKSVASNLKLAQKRASLAEQKSVFDYSIYSLPVMQQNTLKWLSIFPLAILIVVIMRNVVGVSTMGTFTPMLLALSLVKTGFGAGLVCFALIIAVGLLLRALLSKLNLLLVPRISAVVIFVILIMQTLTIIGYKFHLDIAQSAVFFPIIIMSWIIERASITWEEEGPSNAVKEVFWSVVVAIVTYFVISSAYIRHIMFAFNELNIVILLTVMLLGTYTGYRITELRRFSPLVKRKKK